MKEKKRKEKRMGEANKISKKSKAVKCNQAQSFSFLQSKERPYFGCAVAWFKLNAHFPLKYITNICLDNFSHFHCLQA